MKKKFTLIFTLLLTLLYGCSTKSSLEVREDAVINHETPTSVNTTEQEKEEESTDASEDIKDASVIPNYYHSVSDADETGVYLGGVGGIYRINPESGVETLYCAPHLAGATLYKDQIYSMEYNITENGMTANLIRINKDGSGKEILTQISTGSYDLKIIDNVLVISDAIMGDYGTETVFQAYPLDAEGNLSAETPLDIYGQFGLLDGYEDGMRFLINPWFTTINFHYLCYTKTEGAVDINSVWIKKGDEELAREILTCSGKPLVYKDFIFYCDSNGETLTQHYLESEQETTLYKIPDNDNVSLLTYDDEWVYFIQKPRIEELNMLTSSILRVNLQDHRTETIFELLPGSYIDHFNVYGNNCYFILSDEDTTQWECCDLTNFTLTEVH